MVLGITGEGVRGKLLFCESDDRASSRRICSEQMISGFFVVKCEVVLSCYGGYGTFIASHACIVSFVTS